MTITTTPTLEGSPIKQYLGIVNGETIIGANVFRDLRAKARDLVGGRSSAYEGVLEKARTTSLKEMEERAQELGANAIVGVAFDYETVGEGNSMLMVTCNGTAVVV